MCFVAWGRMRHEVGLEAEARHEIRPRVRSPYANTHPDRWWNRLSLGYPSAELYQLR